MWHTYDFIQKIMVLQKEYGQREFEKSKFGAYLIGGIGTPYMHTHIHI